MAYRLGDGTAGRHGLPLAADEFFGDLDHWLDNKGKSNGRVREPEIVGNLLSPALDKLPSSCGGTATG